MFISLQVYKSKSVQVYELISVIAKKGYSIKV